MRDTKRRALLRLVVLAMSLTRAVVAVAQSSPSAAQIFGVVFDSLARKPLAHAEVQLQRLGSASANTESEIRSVVTNTDGTFAFPDVADGSYKIGFFSLTSDSLGVTMPTRQVDVRGGKTVRADLAIPSHAGLIALVCGKTAVSHQSALLMGFIRDAETLAPAEKSAVLLQWDELVIGKRGMRGETKQITTHPRGDGWYAFCNVPVENMMQLRVTRDADTSGVISADLVGRQVVRRDLYIGTGRRVTVPDSQFDENATIIQKKDVWRGDAQISGVVRSSTGMPLPRARVSIEGSDALATANERGEFVLTGLPSGSQTLTARALGYVPERTSVRLARAHPQNDLVVSLTSLKSFLDTIRVTTTRVYTSDENGFEGRKRAGQGHYIDRAQIERQQITLASDLLRMIPRVEVMTSAAGFFGKVVAFRKPFAFEGYCRPDLYVDGFLFRSGDMEIDEIVMPDQIEGMEVYTKPALAPAQFTNNMSGCGSIVVWTRKMMKEEKKKK